MNESNHQPGYDRDDHPGLGPGHGIGPGHGLGHGPLDPTDPAWGDVIDGIWHRLTRPLPPPPGPTS